MRNRHLRKLLYATSGITVLVAAASYLFHWEWATALMAWGLSGAPIFGMIIDSRLEFAKAQSVAAVASTILVGNVDDLVLARDIGNTQPLWLVITVDTEIITGGSAGTIKFQFVSDGQAAIATDGTATVHFDSGTFATGAAASNPLLAKGATLVAVQLPLQGKVYEEFLGILAIIATTTTTAGKINAFITSDPSHWVALDDGR